MIFYEPLSSSQAAQVVGYRPGKAIYVPKCISIFSHHPYYQLFRHILFEAHMCFISSIGAVPTGSSNSLAPVRTRAGTALRDDLPASKSPRVGRAAKMSLTSGCSYPLEFLIRVVTKESRYQPPATIAFIATCCVVCAHATILC
jgi:hypothetical protein